MTSSPLRPSPSTPRWQRWLHSTWERCRDLRERLGRSTAHTKAKGGGKAAPRLIAPVLEELEDRTLLTNYLVIDFTPDQITGEIHPDSFLTTFTGTDTPTKHKYEPNDYSFLDFAGTGPPDGVIDARDANAFADAIAQNVRQRFAPFIKDASLDVRIEWTRNLAQDKNEGQRLLHAAEDSDTNRVYVIYVGGTLPLGYTSYLGIADQGLEDSNNQWYGYAFAEEIAYTMAGKNSTNKAKPSQVIASKSNSTNGQDLLGTLSVNPADPEHAKTRVQVANADFLAAGVGVGDYLEFSYLEDGEYVTGSKTIVSVVDAHTLVLEDEPLSASTWTSTRKVSVVRQVFYTSQDYVNRVGMSIAHEFGHLLGLGHVRKDDAHPNPTPDLNIMNYSADWAQARFTKGASPYQTEVRTGSGLDDFDWDNHQNPYQEVRNSFRRDTDGDFIQDVDSNVSDKTYKELLDLEFAGGLDPGDPPPFAYDFPVASAPPASTGTLGTTSAADVSSQLASGFNSLQQQVLINIGQSLNLPSSALPLIASRNC